MNDAGSSERASPLPEASPPELPADTSSDGHAGASAESADAGMECRDGSDDASSARFDPAPVDGPPLPCLAECEPAAACADRAAEVRRGDCAAGCCFPAVPSSRFRPRRRTLPLTADSVIGGPRASATWARVHPASQSSVSFSTRSGVQGLFIRQDFVSAGSTPRPMWGGFSRKQGAPALTTRLPGYARACPVTLPGRAP